MNREKGNGKAFFFQLLKRMQNSMVLKHSGDQVPFAFSCTRFGGRTYGLIVCFTPSGCEVNLPRFGTDTLCNCFPCLLNGFPGLLTNRIQAGGIPVLVREIGQHGVQCRRADAGGSGITA